MSNNSKGNRIFFGYPLDLLLNRDCKFSEYRKLIGIGEKEVNFEGNPDKQKIGGIQLPSKDKPGTGNIIIHGRPGTAKSTLALQLAVLATQPCNFINVPEDYSVNNCISFFITLEETPENVLHKAEILGWEDKCRILNQLCEVSQLKYSEDFKNHLIKTLTQNPKECPINNNNPENTIPADSCITHNKRRNFLTDKLKDLEKYFNGDTHIAENKEEYELLQKEINDSGYISPTVIINTLTPRYINNNNEEKSDKLFFDRFEQLEKLLGSAKAYNDSIDNHELTLPRIGMVFIDSLNVFGENLLTRTEIFRLFDLLKRYKIMGIFIVEEDETSLFRNETKLHGETIEYLADMVISLSTSEDDGYFVRYFEITKSRYQPQVYGKHPFKILDKTKGELNSKEKNPLEIYPSLHYLVSGTDIDKSANTKFNEDNAKLLFFDNNIWTYLPKNIKSPAVILIEGPQATFKTTLARDFLMRGLLNKNYKPLNDNAKPNEKTSTGEEIVYEDAPSHVLFIRFVDGTPKTKEQPFPRFILSNECYEIISKQNIKSSLSDECIEIISKQNIESFYRDFSEPDKGESSPKRFLFSWYNKEKKARYTELVVKSGYLMPEEFLQIFLETYNFYTIQQMRPTRVVLDEIGRIGSSYPLLAKSKTAGELFLTAFTHIIRNFEINMVITGSIGEYIKSDNIIKQARTLVDTVLITKNMNVFGDNYVTIEGEGLIISGQGSGDLAEKVPGVIKPATKPGKISTFEIVKDKFEGLVGFDTEDIHRPGASLYLYEEQDTHKYYNDEIEILLNSAFGSFKNERFESEVNWKKDVSLYRIKANTTTAFHDSLGVLEGKPLEKTVICAVDEFFRAPSKNVDKLFLNFSLERIEKISTIIAANIKKKHNDPQKNRTYTLPYYDNVLLLAINKDYVQDYNRDDFKDWISIFNLIEKIKTTERQDKISLVDFNANAEETLSCVFLDIIFKIYYNDKKTDNNENKTIKLSDIFKSVDNPVERKAILQENLKALRNTLRLAQKSILWRDVKKISKNDKPFLFDSTIGKINDSENLAEFNKPPKIRDYISKKFLSPDSALYICWFSELRHLLNIYPDLGDKIRVFRLPGGGFRGDWHLGILKGSVSENLGFNILEILCSEREDYKRFVKGVGLPTSERFYNNDNNVPYLAWPNSNLNDGSENESDLSKNESDLSKVYKIHSEAQERRFIDNYLDLRHTFRTLIKQLIMIEDNENDTEYVEKEITRIIINRIEKLLEDIKK